METTLTSGRGAEPASGHLTVSIEGLDRAPDAGNIVARVLEGTPGVVRAYVNPDTEMAYMEYRQDEVTPGELFAAVEAAGFEICEPIISSLGAGATSTLDQARGPSLIKGIPPDQTVADDHSCCGPSVSSVGDPAFAIQGASAPARAREGGARGTLPFRARLGIFLGAALLVMGSALWLVRPIESNAMSADFSVNMSMTGFTPRDFSIPAGKAVSVQLNNVDSPFHGVVNGALHQFAVDKIGIDVRLDGKETTVINLPALEPGTYQFYCNVCCGGKVNPSMQGTITVRGEEGALVQEGVSQR